MDEDELVVNITSNLVKKDTSINIFSRIFPKKEAHDYVAKIGKKYGFDVYSLGPIKVPPSWGGNASIYPIVLVKSKTKTKQTYERPIVLFLGHLDVVPVTEKEKKFWKQIDPFSGKIEGDRIYGRGAFDMKGGDAAFITAFSLKEIEKGTVVIAFSGDEEVGGFISMPKIISFLEEKNLMPNYVINGEPSTVPVIVTKRRASTKLRIVFPLYKKKVMGVLREEEYESFQGDGNETLHSALYVLGADSHALLTAAKMTVGWKINYLESSSKKWNSVPKSVKISYIDEFPEKEEEIERKEYYYYEGLTKVLEGLVSLPSIDWEAEKSTYGISVAPNIVILDDKNDVGEIVIDLRAMLRDGTRHKEIRRKVEEHFKQFLEDVEVKVGAAVNSMFSPPDSKVVLALKQTAEKHGVHVLRIGEKLGGASDSRYFSELGIPCAELGPSGRNAHGPLEWVSISSLRKLVKIYQDTFDLLTLSA